MQDAFEPPTRPSRLALTAVIASACAVILMATAPAANRYYMVDQLVTSGDLSRVTSEIKVHAWVLAGSIRQRVLDGEAHQTMVIHARGKKLRMFSKGSLADPIRDQAELVATGTLVPADEMTDLAAELGVTLEPDLPYVLDVSSISAKCATKYEAPAKALKYE